jgi:hypothetical protein
MKNRRFRPPSALTLVILLATIAAVIACGAVLWAVILANRVVELSADVRSLAQIQQDGRRELVDVVCSVNTTQNRTLRALLVEGAKGSRVFEELYRQYGAPPYRVRLAQARANARRLPDMDCAALDKRARTG